MIHVLGFQRHRTLSHRTRSTPSHPRMTRSRTLNESVTLTHWYWMIWYCRITNAELRNKVVTRMVKVETDRQMNWGLVDIVSSALRVLRLHHEFKESSRICCQHVSLTIIMSCRQLLLFLLLTCHATGLRRCTSDQSLTTLLKTVSTLCLIP